MTTVDEIYSKITILSARLKADATNLTARAKKRIFQRIGKYKADLTNLGSVYDTERVAQAAQELIDSGVSISDIVDGDEGLDEAPEVKRTKLDSKDVTVTPTASTLETAGDIPFSNVNTDKLKEKNLSKKEAKAMIHFLVQQLNEFAVKKQLVKAKKLIKQSKKKGLQLDLHCYTNLINVHVRCNDIEGASKVLTAMEEEKVKPNIVTFTTFLKGLCEVGQISQAIDLYEKKMIPSYQHNVRSFSTFLRGCLRTGSADSAMHFYNLCFHKYYESSLHVTEYQDASIIESLVSLLWRSSQLQLASEIVISYLRNAEGGKISVLESAGLYVMLSKCCSLFGLLQESTKYLLLAQAALEQTAQLKLKLKMKRKFFEAEDNENSDEDNAKKGSSELFQSHKHAELSETVEDIEDYMSVIHTIYDEKNEKMLKIISCVCYMQMLSKFMCFGYDGQGDVMNTQKDDSMQSISSKLIASSKEKLGLGRGMETMYGEDVFAQDEYNTLYNELVDSVEKSINQNFDGAGRLVFEQLFSSQKRKRIMNASNNDNVPIYLEIGAGHGDWIIGHAAHHRDTSFSHSTSVEANWIALELRFDRSHEILTKHCFSLRPTLHGLLDLVDKKKMNVPIDLKEDLNKLLATNNLAVLSGDANKIISKHIPHRSIDGIFVNFPQPPERSSGAGNQGQHLLTKEFFFQLHHTLTENGKITILTDNLPYALMLGESLASTAKYGDISYLDTEGLLVQQEYKLQEDKGKVTVYRGQPPPDTGHVQAVTAKSYFDKLWQHGHKKRRWFISVQKL